ncbi:MAG TPA: lipid-A-disaccharide synthase [Pseudomonadales bacterium]|nr:lipid-A-disaccharide synthase [Pseudomonadales bacterium]
MTMSPRIALVAGEVSGDLLGGPLMAALKQRFAHASFEGIGGERMLAQGLSPLAEMERLSVMGLVEVLGRLPELLALRHRLVSHWIDDPPDLFIGIDAPDFNLGLEARLHAAGIRTAHYVSPSVWAWRQGRVKKIGKAVDLMLTLFPFEADFYRKADVAVEFVGHPLADELIEFGDAAAHRAAFDLSAEVPLVALLPGSRAGEVSRLAPLFFDTAAWCLRRLPALRFILPCANTARRAQLEQLLAQRDDSLPISLVDGRSREAMAAADAVLVASGTATLEAMLIGRPMVIAYRLAPLSFWILSKLVKVPHVGLPNLLLHEQIVPEFLQNAAQPELLGQELLRLLESDSDREPMLVSFAQVRQQLARDASQRAAEAVSRLLPTSGSDHPIRQSQDRVPAG